MGHEVRGQRTELGLEHGGMERRFGARSLELEALGSEFGGGSWELRWQKQRSEVSRQPSERSGQKPEGGRLKVE